MLSFAELLKAIDKFYVLAQKPFPMVKKAAEDLYEKGENIWDQLSNEELANQLRLYLDSYMEFLNSINITPKQFSETLDPNSPVGKDSENFLDYKAATERRWERLLTNKYLNLDLEDPKWEEGLSPIEIKDFIDEVIEDVKKRWYEAGAKSGIRPDDLDDMKGVSEEIAFEQAAQAKSPETKEDKENQRGADVIDRQRQAATRSREKIKIIRQMIARTIESLKAKGINADKNIGLQHLISQRAQLESQIALETNLETKKELQRRLDGMPNPESYVKYRANQRAQFQRATDTDDKRKAYFAKALPRLQNLRTHAQQFEKMTAEYEQATDPNKKASIKLKMIDKMKEHLKRKKYNLDDAFVLNSPEIQAMLNPDNIMNRYRTRNKRIKNEFKKQLETRQENKAAGNLAGLVQKYSESVASELAQVKYNLNSLFDDDPAVKPYKEAIAKAKATRDAAGIKLAVKNLETFLKGENYQKVKMNHTDFKAAAEMATNMRTWILLLKTIDQTKALDAEVISEGVRQEVLKEINNGKKLIEKYIKNASINQRAQDIISYLENRILT